MTDEPGAQHLLAMLGIERHDRPAVAVSHRIGAARAAELAEQISVRLDQAAVPPQRRIWIVGGSDDPAADAAIAEVLGALSDSIGAARLELHDPRDPDRLIFRRRPPNQKRGGVYLNASWMQASIRIACGPPSDLAAGLSAWFNHHAVLDPEHDLDATLIL